MLRCFRSTKKSSGIAGKQEQVHLKEVGKGACNLGGLSDAEPVERYRRSWLLVDDGGNLTLQEANLEAAAVQFGVPLRDVSLVDPQEGLRFCPAKLASRSPRVESPAKGQVLLVCLEGLRLIISTKQALILGVPATPGSLEKSTSAFSDAPLVRDLISRLRISTIPDRPGDYVDKSLPFTLLVLEWALASALGILTKEVLNFERASQPVLDELARKVTHSNIANLRHIKLRDSCLRTRVDRFRQELQSALGDSVGKSTTGRSKRSRRSRHRVKALVLEPGSETECASLLECYLIQVEAASNALRGVKSTSRSTEDMAKLSVKLQRLRLGHY